MHKLLLITTILISFVSISSTKLPTKKLLIPTKQNIKSAKIFAEIIKKIERNKYTTKQINYLKRTDKDHLFSTYNTELNTLKTLKIKNAPKNTLKHCKKYLKKTTGASFRASLLNKISNLCHKKLLSSIHMKSKSVIDDDIISYFIDFSIMNSKNRTKQFNSFLNQLKKENINVYKVVSKNIYTNFITNSYHPNFKSLTALPTDKMFTSFLQSNHKNRNIKSNVFFKELRVIYKRINKSFEDRITLRKHIKEYIKFYSQNNEKIPYTKISRYIDNLSRKLAIKGYENEARLVINSFIPFTKENSESEHQLLYKLLWTSLIKDDFAGATKEIHKLKLIKRYSKLGPKLKFWIPYILKNNNDQKTALVLYRQFIEENSINYYSILAHKEISLLEDTSNRPSLDNNSNLNHYTFSSLESKTMKRTLTWLEIGHNKYANQEMNPIFNNVNSSRMSSFLYKVTTVFNNNKHFLFTFKILYKALSRNIVNYDNKTVKSLFPTTFYKDIRKLAKEIDPIIVISLIRQESAFNPNAKSHVGARGLMQLMPATARQFNKKLKIKHLRDPKTNLKLGIKYLTRLLNRYEGNLIYTLSAYNAGETRVRRWRKNLFISKDPLVNIESIPFNETRKYVKLIYRNIYFYKYLLKEENNFKSLQDTFFVAFR